MRGLAGLITGRREAARIKADPAIDDAFLDALGDQLEGFSGREISKLFISAQGIVYGRNTAELTRGMLEKLVQVKIAEHDAKSHFGSSAYDYVSQIASPHAVAQPVLSGHTLHHIGNVPLSDQSRSGPRVDSPMEPELR